MLGDDGAILLSGVLTHTTTIVHVDLSANMISKDVYILIKGGNAIFNAIAANASVTCLNLDSKNGQYNYLNRCGDSIKQMFVNNHLLTYLSLNETKLGNNAFDKLVEGVQNNSTIAHIKLIKNGIVGCKSVVALLEMPIYEIDLSKNSFIDVIW